MEALVFGFIQTAAVPVACVMALPLVLGAIYGVFIVLDAIVS